jgi:hypothetical protein
VPNKHDRAHYLALLQNAIQRKHGCGAVHRETVFVHETCDKTTIWRGDVEVFALTGHAEAERCYAWSHVEGGTDGKVLNSQNLRLITVLGKRPVDSPAMAVRAAIFYDVQPAPVRE